MARELLIDVLPETIVSHIVEPYYSFTDLLFRYLDDDEINTHLWKRMFEQHYPRIYDMRMYPLNVQQQALNKAPEDQDLLTITLMLGYFTDFGLEKMFTYQNNNKFTDLTMWVYLKRHHDRIDLDNFLLSQYDDLIKAREFSTLLFLVKQVGVIFDVYPFLEEFVALDKNDENDEMSMKIRHRNELIQRVIDHGIAEDYRPLDHHFTPREWDTETSVFEHLIVYIPELAEYYIDTFEVDEVIDYMLLIDTETYLHVAARADNPVLYQKLQTKKPILARIKNTNGKRPRDIKTVNITSELKGLQDLASVRTNKLSLSRRVQPGSPIRSHSRSPQQEIQSRTGSTSSSRSSSTTRSPRSPRTKSAWISPSESSESSESDTD